MVVASSSLMPHITNNGRMVGRTLIPPMYKDMVVNFFLNSLFSECSHDDPVSGVKLTIFFTVLTFE